MGIWYSIWRHNLVLARRRSNLGNMILGRFSCKQQLLPDKLKVQYLNFLGCRPLCKRSRVPKSGSPRAEAFQVDFKVHATKTANRQPGVSALFSAC